MRRSKALARLVKSATSKSWFDLHIVTVVVVDMSL